jgi:hypothetical protein
VLRSTEKSPFERFIPVKFYIFALLNRRLYNPEIAKGDLSDIKGDLSVAKV